MDSEQRSSYEAALDQAWRDHHHARDQTWKTLQVVAALAGGLVAIDAQFGHPIATTAAALLPAMAAAFGIAVTLRHRNKVEVLKFQHIDAFQRALGLDRVIGTPPLPGTIRLLDALLPWKQQNTSLFIVRLHIAILLFVVLFAGYRWWLGSSGAT